MHEEALDVLPGAAAGGRCARPVLVGHSDGGSIALIHASAHPVSGLVLLAPHVFVEDVSVASIEEARETFETTDLGERMGRYHRDAERPSGSGTTSGWHPSSAPGTSRTCSAA